MYGCFCDVWDGHIKTRKYRNISLKYLFVSRKYRCSNVCVFVSLVQVHKECPTDSKTTSYTKTPSTTEPSTPIATSQRGIVSTFLPTNEQFTISKPLFRTVVKGKLYCCSPLLSGRKICCKENTRSFLHFESIKSSFTM